MHLFVRIRIVSVAVRPVVEMERAVCWMFAGRVAHGVLRILAGDGRDASGLAHGRRRSGVVGKSGRVRVGKAGIAAEP
ncbi:MAG: hypothetical protein LBR22_02065 [Desulfovibrio sp.]|jgi:hypothetical protein|nr:hypothetical protein [Desulfovibrio sp.]